MQNAKSKLPKIFLSLLLLLAMAVSPVTKSYAQDSKQEASTSKEDKLKLALKETLNQLEVREFQLKILKSQAEALAEQGEAAESLLALKNEEIASMGRLRSMDKEQIARLEQAIADLQEAGKEKDKVIVSQAKTIENKNGQVKVLKVLVGIAGVGGAILGVVLGAR